MHSLRAAFTEAGITTPPFMLRKLAQRKGTSPPITIRKVMGLPPAVQLPPPAFTFPENEIELFKSYDLKPGEKNSDFISTIVKDIKDTKFDEFNLAPNISANTEAIRLKRHRRRLIEILESLASPSSVVEDNTKLIRKHILTRQADQAEGLLNKGFPKKTIQFPSSQNQPIWKNALRRDNVDGFVRKPNFGVRRVKLLGYNGPEVPIEKLTDVRNFLDPESVERRFREGLMMAESLAGQRQFGGKKHDENLPEGAIEKYEKLFGIQDLPNEKRKFVALRQATAQNALADQRFNALRPGDETEREKVKEIYLETAEILRRRGVNNKNPVAQDLIVHADNQLILVESGFNALGSSTVMSAGYQIDPISGELLISKKAVDFLADAENGLDQAKSALESFRSFTGKLKGELGEKISLNLNRDETQTTLDNINGEINIIGHEKKKLGETDSFLDKMIPLQGAATGTAIIEASMIAAIGGPAAGLGAIALNGAARILELGHQKALLSVDQRILDLKKEALGARHRQAERRLNAMNNLIVDNEVEIQNLLELTNSFEDFTIEAMRSVLRNAFQAEVQLAFERGTALDLAKMIINPGEILNVKDDNDINEMIEKFSIDEPGKDSQLKRLRERINKLISGGIVDKQFSLKELDIGAFLRFKQTGVTDFYISLYDLDRFFPGRTNMRITDVHIDLDNLDIPIDGITVTLTHRGNFLVRDPRTVRNTTKLIPEDSVVNHAEIELRKGLNATIDGVTFIRAAESSRSFVVGGEPSPFPNPPIPPNLRRGLEGYGIAGLWNIEINENELGEFELANLKDVFLTFQYSFVEADGQARGKINRLIQEFETEQDHTRDVITSFSMRDTIELEEKLVKLINETPHKVDIEINEQAGILEGQYEQTLLKGIVLQVVNNDGGVAGVEVMVRRGDVNRNFQYITVAEGFTANLTDENSILVEEPNFPVGGTWTIEVPDTNALIDRGDIRWFLLHDEKPPRPSET